MVVMVMVMVSAIPRHHNDARIVAVMMPIEAMVMVMVVVMVELGQLDGLRRRSWSRLINCLQQRYGVRNRLQQVGV
jgi:hypothetical protein